MTTIAYKNGIIAYDSRMTRGDVILSDEINKMQEHKGVYFFFVGAISDIEMFINIYFGAKSTYNIDCSAIVFDNGKLFSVAVENKERVLFRTPMQLDITDAMGSGEQFAMMAMDCGFSAEKAVKMAMKRDSNTGGIIRTFKLDDHKGCGGPENGK